jgi:hypothetical protein
VSTYWRTLETLSAVRAEVLDASGPENQEALEKELIAKENKRKPRKRRASK